MNNIVNIKKPSEIMNGLGLVLIAICFIFIHLNSKPAQTQLTFLPLILPFFLLLPIKKKFYPTEVKFLFLVFCIFLSSLTSYGLLGEIFTQDFRSHWVYLLAFGVLAIFSQTRISKAYLIILLLSASLMVAYNVTVEYFNNGYRGNNTHGKPIFFGNIALTTGLVSLVLSMKKDNCWLVRGLLLCSAVAGIAGSVWSQSRGGWIFLVLFLCMFIYINIVNAKNKKKSYSYSFIFLIVIIFISLPFKNLIDQRISSAYSNIHNYIVLKDGNSSVGVRFELWRIAVEQFIDDPLVGSARSGFLKKRNLMVDQGVVAVSSSGFEHAHSDIFWTIGTKGLIGLITLYGLYAFLIRFYYIHSQRKEVRIYALSGLTVVSSYIVYGLSESFFSMKLGIGYFIIINAMLIRIICLNSKEQEKTRVLFRRQ
jgi:O-antigen ligase